MPLKRRYYWIDHVGVELEGGWRRSRTGGRLAIGDDRSVKCGCGDNDGEVASPPLKPREIAPWMRRNYPDVVNATCGLHVHISVVHNLAYARLQEVEFRDFMLSYLQAWGTAHKIRRDHPFWKRLAGGSYCYKRHHPEKQLWVASKSDYRTYTDRYTQLNYCWGLHGTVENRTLPGFMRPFIGIAAVIAVVNCVEEYLRTRKTRIRPVYAALSLSTPEPVCEAFEEQFEDEPSAAFTVTLPDEPTTAEFNLEI